MDNQEVNKSVKELEKALKEVDFQKIAQEAINQKTADLIYGLNVNPEELERLTEETRELISNSNFGLINDVKEMNLILDNTRGTIK